MARPQVKDDSYAHIGHATAGLLDLMKKLGLGHSPRENDQERLRLFAEKHA